MITVEPLCCRSECGGDVFAKLPDNFPTKAGLVAGDGDGIGGGTLATLAEL
jgi:hypothetical protein